MTPLERLRNHSNEFRKEIIGLASNVYGAVGFAASNVYMIIADGGVIIVDTTESTKAAENVLAAFRKITALPVRSIIYTHSHRDHISGAEIFAGSGDPEIIASHRFASDLVAVDSKKPLPNKALADRTRRQFGIGLAFPDERVNLGCGPGDRPLEGLGAGFMPPTTRVHEDRINRNVCGVELELVHAPGETPDHLVVWDDGNGILICGDNFYKSFPNLYAIRGTRYRDYDAWADSLDLLLSFDAEILAPGHSRPVVGADKVRGVLTDYRDAIRHVVAETVAGLDRGEGPDELADKIALPASLADKPHLQEFYGKISWSVRAYCAGTLGWFDGNPTNLDRLSPRQEAGRMIALAGGEAALFDTALTAHRTGDHQWSLELLDRLLCVDAENTEYRLLKAACLRARADEEINATARNYYLVAAAEI
ncbi:alkyl/aryl-sulfatase [Nitratireductor sp. XY-223]|uniref:alkyl/aryl-sulfatase n=1 Tax=Nitratireductor sp. XY-223 TaxID=2561926 RepID=UPI0010A9B608|nr:alkyl/aryl-sulfatase [Nitratireductor sp. XY-223]